jgi:hypothetical protein
VVILRHLLFLLEVEGGLEPLGKMLDQEVHLEQVAMEEMEQV